MLSIFEIGEKIAIARKMKNLSQAQLASMMSVTAQAVGKWERGESMPDIVLFQRLAEALGVDMNYFSSFNSAPPTSGTQEAFNEAFGEQSTTSIPKPDWNMSGSIWTDTDFSGLHGLGSKLSAASIDRCQFVASDLSGLQLRGNNIRRSNFTRSNLSGSSFIGTNLNQNDFIECGLGNVSVSGSNISNCNFANSNFTNTTLNGSSVSICDFTSSNLSGATFKWSLLKNLCLTDAVFYGTVFKNGQLSELTFSGDITNCAFEFVDFHNVEFAGCTIRNTFFKNAKLKRAKFSDCKADKLSYAFLKSCKADLSHITLIEE